MSGQMGHGVGEERIGNEWGLASNEHHWGLEGSLNGHSGG